MKIVEAEYIDSGGFQGGEEDTFLAGIKHGGEVVILNKSDWEAIKQVFDPPKPASLNDLEPEFEMGMVCGMWGVKFKGHADYFCYVPTVDAAVRLAQAWNRYHKLKEMVESTWQDTN